MELGVTPEEGAVIRYSFLWSHEYKAGRSEGSKDRACVVVMSSDTGRVLVTPITSHPGEGSTVIDLPLAIKRRLGLDERRSWVIVSELNKFTWPGFDVRALPGGDPFHLLVRPHSARLSSPNPFHDRSACEKTSRQTH